MCWSAFYIYLRCLVRAYVLGSILYVLGCSGICVGYTCWVAVIPVGEHMLGDIYWVRVYVLGAVIQHIWMHSNRYTQHIYPIGYTYWVHRGFTDVVGCWRQGIQRLHCSHLRRLPAASVEGCVHRLGRGQQPQPRQLATHHRGAIAQCAEAHHDVGHVESRRGLC